MPQTYTVKEGETLWGIAEKLKVPTAERTKDLWKKWGYAGDPTKLQIGTVLTIPDAKAPAEPTFDPATYAKEKGYTKYFQKEGAWYGSVAGTWKTFRTRERARSASVKAGELTTEITETKEEIATKTKELEQARIDAANQANQNAQEIFDALPGDEVDMRDSVKILEDIFKKMAVAEEEAPTPVSLVDLFKEQKEKLGIEPLETELADLDADIERIQTELLVQAEEAGEKLVSTREIGRAKGVLQKRAEREVALLNVERSAVARMYNNKLTTLNTIMQLTQQDFANASQTYQQEFSRNMQMISLLQKEEALEVTRETRLKNEAKSNWTTIVNLFAKQDMVWSDIDSDIQSQIENLALQAGIPTGATKAFFTQKPKAEVMATVEGVNDAGEKVVSFIYTDPDTGRAGITETVIPGVKAPVSAAGVKAEKKEKDIAWADELLSLNPDASYEELDAAIRDNTDLSDGDIDAKIRAKRILPRKEVEKVEEEKKKELERKYDTDFYKTSIRESLKRDHKKSATDFMTAMKKNFKDLTDTDLKMLKEMYISEQEVVSKLGWLARRKYFKE